MPKRLVLILLVLVLAFAGCEDRRSPTEKGVGWWPPGERGTARCIVHYESGGNPAARSPGGGNHGLFQINSVHRGAFEQLTHVSFYPGVYDPVLNGQYAYVLWKQTGWRSSWSTHALCGV